MMYESFAGVYDILMDDIPYEEWGKTIIALLKERGINDGLVLDLGCGTGRLTRILARAGYDMIGVDASPDMLQIARENDDDAHGDILYIQQQMDAFELYGTVRAVVCTCDSLNYLTEPSALLETFKLVNMYLDPGGVFIFDMKTLFEYREMLGDTVFAEDLEDFAYIWDNEWDEESRINTYGITLFVPGRDGLFRREREMHVQRCYAADEVAALIERAGMKTDVVCEGYTLKELSEKSERMLFVAREQEKQERLFSASGGGSK